MKSIIFILLCSVNSIAIQAHEMDGKEHQIHHPIFPFILGAGLITWGAYELGSDAEEGQRNVQLLWGSTVLVSAGIILYQSKQQNGNSKTLAFQNAIHEPSIKFSFRF